ncbi:MAG: MltA domain-containing protein [Burkholderiales bacterium]|nr:MltA domain-containing protein [Burkholderiales bacterium]
MCNRSTMIRDARVRAAAWLAAALLGAAALGGCASAPKPAPRELACPAPAPCPACPVCPVTRPEPPPAPPLAPASFAELPGWADDDLTEVWEAFLRSCRALRMRDAWVAACGKAAELEERPSSAAIRAYLEANFAPYRATNPDGTTEGRITGYYEPLLAGSRERRAPFVHPLYGPPDDLLVIDLASVAPETRHLRLRGRVEGRRVVPYYTRAEIERGEAPVVGKEIVWVDDAIEAFFLQIQGSGRVRLRSGEMLRIGYADQNGHPYASIGRYLVDQGELALEQASMQGIQAWARANPARVAELLNQNPSYVFFRELPPGNPADGLNALTADRGPPGALGVPLTAGRSIAVDRRFIPLGAPVYLATTQPNSDVPLARLVMAQDTGGAIRGPVRADFFWGTGREAGRLAGRMRQTGRMWVLLPLGFPLPQNGGSQGTP